MIKSLALEGRHSGELELRSQELVFNYEEPLRSSLSIPLSLIKVQTSGENSTQFLLICQTNPPRRLILQNKLFIQKLALAGVISASEALRQGEKRKKRRFFLWGMPFLGTILGFFVFPLLLSLTPAGWLDQAISFEQERQMGQFLVDHLAPTTVDENSPSTRDLKTLQDLGAYLQAANPKLQPIPFRFRISPSMDVNAYALPGALLVFNQGLLKRAESMEEIAGVMAHEMAHVERRHNLKSMVAAFGKISGLVMIGFVVGGDSAQILSAGTELLSLKYSRGDETEADLRGLQFLQRAHIDPQGMISFFEKLAQESPLGPKAESLTSLMSTHPPTASRLKALKLEIKKASGPYTPLPFNLSDLNKKN